MAVAITRKPKEYILESDRELPKEAQTVFHLRPLSYAERCDLQDNLFGTEIQRLGPKNESEGTTNVKAGTNEKLLLLYGISKIENLKDGGGELLVYNGTSKKNDKLTVLSMLEQDWCSELAKEIRSISGLSKEEAKN